MTHIGRPNAWVAVEEATTLLTYAPVVNPAPLTTSVPDPAPTLGSLVVAITNNQAKDLPITRVAFTVVVGKPGPAGAPLMSALPASHGVSDDAEWELAGPPASFSQGKAEYTLTPKAGGTLKAGESVLIELSDFPTVEEPGSSIVAVEEVIAGTQETSFSVPTFPAGFFFDNLVATVKEGSEYIPVAQVERGRQKVVLLWSTSVPAEKQTVRYSNPAEGQKVEKVTESGFWESPALTADTVFSVGIEEKGANDETLPAGLTVAVAVKDPALVAVSLQAEAATVDGALNTESLTASKAVNAASATLTGALGAESASLSGALSAQSATVSKALSTAALSASGAVSLSGALASSGKVEMLKGPEKYSPGKYSIPTDGFLIFGEIQTFPAIANWNLEVASKVGQFEWLPIGSGKLTPIQSLDEVKGPILRLPSGPHPADFVDLLAPFLAQPLDEKTRAALIEALGGTVE